MVLCKNFLRQLLELMEDILILMSTYNGEKYISEQIESIISQKGVIIHLLIRDDGSNDSTVRIIQHYISLYPNTIGLIKGSNIGWKESFFYLLQYAQKHYPFKYYAFADQDDIWLPEKLKRAVELMSQHNSLPTLYCSNLIYYKEGKAQGVIYKKDFFSTYKNCLIRNYAIGCTIVLNNRLLRLIVKEIPQLSIAHDYWCYMVASLCGKVIIDPMALIFYRQHNENQIGCKGGFLKIWTRRLKSFSSLISGHNKENIARELLRIHVSDMNMSAKKALLKVVHYRDSLRNRLSLLFDKDYTYNKVDSDFWLKCRIICGKL